MGSSVSTTTAAVPAFGKEIMAQEFMLNPENTYLNQGSWGNAPRKVIQYKTDMIVKWEDDPNVFRNTQSALWAENLVPVCEFLGSDLENLVFVNNATTGINSVLKSVPLHKGDAILTYTYTYFSVKNTAEIVAEEKELEVIEMEIPDQIESVQQLVDAYEKMFQDHLNIRLVILDHISSTPPILFPLTELIASCRRFNKMVLVDGAHCPGHVDLNLEEIDADFYVANLHKWAFAPRGCAILWIRPAYHALIHPCVTSFIAPGDITTEFSWQGTADLTNFYISGKAIEFIEEIGGYEAISAYCSNLADKGADMLVEQWGTQHAAIPASMRAPFMRNVLLPDLKKFPKRKVDKAAYKNSEPFLVDLHSYLWDNYKIWATFPGDKYGRPWLRMSVSVFNEMADYEKLAAAILEIAALPADKKKITKK